MKKLIKKAGSIFCTLAYSGLLNWMPDESYLKLRFRAELGMKLNLKNPRTYNEKLQWLKIHNRRPEYTRMVDKYEAKQYIAELIGEEYIIPTLGVWDSFDEINFDALPDQFVLKTTHDSGGVVICKGKRKLDFKEARRTLERHRRRNYFYWGREWPYKNVKPRIMAEQYMVDKSGEDLKDHKFYCFNGKMKLFMLVDHPTDTHFAVYHFWDREGNVVPIEWGCESIAIPPMPKEFEKMVEIAEQLSKGIPHVRVDLLYVNHKMYVGELTFFDGSGFEEIKPIEWDYQMGEWLQLPDCESENA